MGKMKKQISIIRFKLDTDDIKDHRYRSIDDWWDPHEWTEELRFKTVVADMGNPDYNFLVLLHAMVEQYLCYRHGVTDKEVTKFDTGIGKDLDEPGADTRAPYYAEHEIATEVEVIVSAALNVDWVEYEKTEDKVIKRWKKNEYRIS